MDAMTGLLLLAGLALLTAGAHSLVQGSVRLAQAAGVSALVVGLTVVSWGTSAPELAVNIKAAYADQPDLAVGNIVGSNIFNVLFILGLCAAILPLRVHRQLVRMDVPIMLAVSVLGLLLSLDGRLSRGDGVLMLVGMAAYTLLQVRMGRKEAKPAEPPPGESEAVPSRPRFPWRGVAEVVLGLGLLVVGARWFVDACITSARALGVSELVIGLTVVAAGTSMPEVATSVVATIKGQRDIAVGNVVGSNIFNILGILGFTALLAPLGVPVAPPALSFDMPVMIAVALACLPIFFSGHTINRWEGLLFLSYYAAYTAYLILFSTQHESLTGYTQVMTAYILPLTGVTLAVIGWREWRATRVPRRSGNLPA